MQTYTSGHQRPPIVLSRHPLALLPGLMVNAFICGAFIAISLPAAPVLGLVAVAVASIGLTLHYITWRTFRINIYDDRITIRQLRFGVVQHTTYALAGLRNISYRQSALDLLFNCGTLALHQNDRQLRFTLLTPYAYLAHALTG